MITFKLHGFEELKRALSDFDIKIQKKMEKGALRDGAKIIAADAKVDVPVDKGDLRRGIKVRVKKKLPKGQVGISVISSSKEYNVVHQEYGTSKMEAHPYLRPALQHNISTVVNAIRAGLNARILAEYLNARI